MADTLSKINQIKILSDNVANKKTWERFKRLKWQRVKRRCRTIWSYIRSSNA